jgi:hypothetical protein
MFRGLNSWALTAVVEEQRVGAIEGGPETLRVGQIRGQDSYTLRHVPFSDPA